MNSRVLERNDREHACSSRITSEDMSSRNKMSPEWTAIQSILPPIMVVFSLQSRSAFTLIEVLIAILIFSLGLIAAFVLTSTATSLSMRSKQEIIATNLLREQLEIAKNIRDTNFLALRKYDSL